MFASLRIRTALVFLLSLSVPAVAGAATIALAWNANTEANIAGYRVHYGTQPGSYTTIVDRGNTLTASVTGLADGTRYYFVVVAYDTTGAQSAFSAEVNDIPPPPIDATPPVATMTAPAAGAQVSGSVALTATATDNVAVAGVTFQVDGVAAGPEDTTAPYSFTWNTTGAANGSHALRAVARDSTGNLGTSPAVTVQVLNDGTAPLILALTPAADATNVSGTAAVTARFDEPLSPSTVSAANFELRTAANALVTATVSYNATTRTARLVPAAPLTPGASFNATVRGGPTGIRDVAGNALATTQLWSFTVAPAPPPLTGLMAAYGFEDGTGTVAADASGMGNPGAITGATWKPGKFGSSLEFNGTSNWVTVANSTDVNLTAALTIEAWVYPTTLTGWRTVALKENGLNGLAYALYAHDSNPKPATYVRLTGASSSVGSAGTAPLPLNTWTHLAATFDGSTLRLHIGGVLVLSQPASGTAIQSSGPLRLGGNAVWGEYFAGRIDEVRLYNRALSVSEIQADMSTPVGTGGQAAAMTSLDSKPGTEEAAASALAVRTSDPDGGPTTVTGTGLVAAYGFDEGRGASAADGSGLGHAGKITGAAWSAGKFGTSLAFDGVSNWVTIAASETMSVTEAMTLEAWVYPTEAAGSRAVVFKEPPAAGWAPSYGLYSTFGAEGPGGQVLVDGHRNAHDRTAIALNRWTHLATTYDGRTVRSYVDGVERAAVAATGPIDRSDGVLRIGGNGVWGEFFKGRIDEVRLYNRALPVAEIRRDMATPVTGTPAR